jgi:ribosomal protein L40E
MSDEKPPMPPGLPPMPPMPPMPPAPPADAAPPAMPEMPPMPPMPGMEAPPAPPMMDAPPAPPAMPEMPPMPPMPGMEAPPAPPMMDAPPAMPPMPPMPAMPEMDAPPAPPMMDAPPAMPPMPPMPAMPEMDALAAPPMPPMGDDPLMAPMPPMPEMDAPAAPPMPPMPPLADDPLMAPPMPPMEAPADPLMAPPMPPMEAPADPLMAPPMPPMEAPADPLMAPPMPPMEAPADPLMAPPMPPMPPLAEDPLMAPPMPPMEAPADPLMAPPMPPMPPLAEDPLMAPPMPPMAEDPLAPAEADLLEAPMDLTGEQAGATIRSSAEVDGIDGDKLEGTLHEVEKSTLTADGEIIKQSVKGTLMVNNPSAEDRIYDIDVMLDHADATDIGGDHVSVDELEAGKSHSMKYKVNGKRMLILRERLDTNPARTSARSLSVASSEDGGPIALEIEVENVASVSVRDVMVTRPLPEEMSFSHAAGAEIDENVLTWNIGTLGAGEKQVLTIEGTITVAGTKKIDAGAATATYAADSTLSNLNFRELDAFCRGFSYMRVREDERPDNWLCKTTFENRSSFAVDLVKLQVRMKGSDDLLFDIKDVKEDVPPHGKWESEERTVMAQSKPDFATDLSYTILPRATRTTEGSITLQSSTLEVVEASLAKTYSTSSLRSYRAQKVTACLTFTNNGSANVNVVRFTDDVPGLFGAPDVSTFTVKVDGKEIADNQFKSEVTEGITLEKTNRSPDGNGYTITTMVGIVAPIGLKPGKSLTIEYDLNAPDPSPNNSGITAPAHCEFSSEKAGPRCGRDAEDAPVISVVHNRRDFSAGKQTLPVGGKGRYEVLILFENNGDTALKDVYINDVMPANFEIKDWHIRSSGGDKRTDCEMSTEDGVGGTHISWLVPIVGKGERLDVFMEIKGSGQIDAEALNRFHGVHFGDEVESDDLPTTDVVEEEVEEAPEEAITEEATEEAPEEATEEAVAEEATAEEPTEEPVEEADSEEAAEASEGPSVTWREDVLLRVMEAAGISADHRDAFVDHAANFDLDDNGYLKKAELEAAAEAWGDDSTSTEDATDEEAPAEEAAEEASMDDKMCSICMSMNPYDATECSACKFAF